MKDSTNAINTMLCLQKVDDELSANRVALLNDITWYDAEQHAEFDGTQHQNSEEQALLTINQCVKFFGNSATKELEERMELLQETFLAYLDGLLQEHNINIQEKLTLSLSADNKLILQCQEAEEALLNALGSDETLLKHLYSLRKAAIVSRGLDYMLSAQDEAEFERLPQFRVCTKGALSHFFLKS